MNRRRGFTLIELLVVVGIIAVLSGLLLPVFLRARDVARRAKERAESAAAAMDAGERHGQPREAAPPTGPPPVIDSLALEMELRSSYHRVGADVTTRYEVECTGQLTFHRAPGEREDRILLLIPFPDATVEARDVRIAVRGPGGGESRSPETVVYNKQGIYCLVSPPSTEPLTAEVGFTALGRERFDLPLPPGRELRATAIRLRVPPGEARTIPDEALQPTAATPDELRWEFTNLVSDRRISVLLPAAETPLARVLLLLRLMAVAVLLFGAGFWYLSEQVRPGRLDGFRLGHFLLLALTYSLFFVIFAVLEFHGRPGTAAAMGISSLFSLPLLALHVSRVLDLKFAISRVVPLAVFTVGLVVNGVYGGAARDYVFLAAAILALGFVTVTYPSWSAGMVAHREAREAAYAARRAALIEGAEMDLGGRVSELTALAADAEGLEQAGRVEAAPGAARARIARMREAGAPLLQEYEELSKRLKAIPVSREWGGPEACERLEREVAVFGERLNGRVERLREEIAAFRSELRPAALSEVGETHCMACGSQVVPAPFCPECGCPQPLEVACGGCGGRTTVPRHIIAEGKAGSGLFCNRCGTRLPVSRVESGGTSSA